MCLQKPEFPDFLSDGEYMAVCTEQVVFGTLKDGVCYPEIDVEHLLELRAFNKMGERRFFRDSLKENSFFVRDKVDAESVPYSMDFVQHLDQDDNYTRLSEKLPGFTEYRTTGGGTYTLPGEKKCKVKLRAYLEQGENGLLVFGDWRIVKLI